MALKDDQVVAHVEQRRKQKGQRAQAAEAERGRQEAKERGASAASLNRTGQANQPALLVPLMRMPDSWYSDALGHLFSTVGNWLLLTLPEYRTDGTPIWLLTSECKLDRAAESGRSSQL